MQKFISHVLDANRAETKMENGTRYGIYWMEGVQRSLLQEETKVRGWGRELLRCMQKVRNSDHQE